MGKSSREKTEDTLILMIVLFLLFGIVLLLTIPQRNWNQSLLCKTLGFIGATVAVASGVWLLIAQNAADSHNALVALGVGVVAYVASFFVAEWIPDAQA
ncbi:MAG: hypothetical protein ACOX6T_04385 [Myxococcales bacterium]|jgi:uncharacterized membrane protein SirB2